MVSIANNALRVSELNMFEIKENLKNFLRGRPEFYDYDFDASTLSRLLDVLSYNDYYMSYYLNMVANEMFLDSTTLRPSAVSRAKELGYTPISMKSAYTDIDLTFVPNNSPTTLIIPKYTRFKTTDSSGQVLNFVTDIDYTLTSTDGITFSTTVRVYEGTILQYKFIYNGSNTPFELPNNNLDTSSLKIYVKENDAATNKVEYTLVDDITELNDNSHVYYLQENAKGNFEVYFGDGILGTALEINNVILIDGRFTNGEEGNSLSAFTPVSWVAYDKDNDVVNYLPTFINVQDQTRGGAEKESIESIQFLAPKYHGRQLRNVTDDDYSSFIIEHFRDIQSVVVWGGEENDPPYYGKVIIATKPITGFVISNIRKNEIRETLKKYNVQTVDPIMVDAIFTYIKLDMDVTYDSGSTVLDKDAVLSKILTTIQNFETVNLSTFNEPFYISKFSTAINNSERSVIDSDINMRLEKRFVPIYNSTVSYKLTYSGALKLPYKGALGCVTSDQFKLTNYEKLLYLDDDGNGKIRLYYKDDNLKSVYVNNNAGTVDYTNGNIVLNGFNFESLITGQSEFKVYVVPDKKTYKPKKNELLLLSHPAVNLIDSVRDLTVATGIADVQGNDSPVQTNSILNPVII